jgi:hypothetical protein
MSKHKTKKFSNFEVKALQTYKVVSGVMPNDDSLFANLSDPRLTRVDGGRRRPIFYDNGYSPTFEPR